MTIIPTTENEVKPIGARDGGVVNEYERVYVIGHLMFDHLGTVDGYGPMQKWAQFRVTSGDSENYVNISPSNDYYCDCKEFSDQEREFYGSATCEHVDAAWDHIPSIATRDRSPQVTSGYCGRCKERSNLALYELTKLSGPFKGFKIQSVLTDCCKMPAYADKLMIVLIRPEDFGGGE